MNQKVNLANETIQILAEGLSIANDRIRELSGHVSTVVPLLSESTNSMHEGLHLVHERLNLVRARLESLERSGEPLNIPADVN